MHCFTLIYFRASWIHLGCSCLGSRATTASSPLGWRIRRRMSHPRAGQRAASQRPNMLPQIKKIFCAHVSFLFRYQCSGCNKVWKTKKSLKGHIYLKHKELLRGDVDSWVNMIARRKHADHRRENSIEITGLSACLIVSFFLQVPHLRGPGRR